jgi:hypothetical protein
VEKLLSAHELPYIIRQKIGNINQSVLNRKAQYLAGLLDGEGCFSIAFQRRPLSFYAQISLGMTDKKTITDIAEIFQVSTATVEREKPHKDLYCLRIHTQQDCRNVCQKLSKYAKTKSVQIQLLLRLLQLKEVTIENKRDYKRVLHEMIDLYISNKKANRRGSPLDYNAIRKDMREMVVKDITRRFG